MFKRWFSNSRNADLRAVAALPGVGIRVVGVGGGGGNAVRRMADGGLHGVDFLVLNTDVQALRSFRDHTDVRDRTDRHERHGIWRTPRRRTPCHARKQSAGL